MESNIATTGSLQQKLSWKEWKFATWVILLSMLVGIASIWSSNKEVLDLKGNIVATKWLL